MDSTEMEHSTVYVIARLTVGFLLFLGIQKLDIILFSKMNN